MEEGEDRRRRTRTGGGRGVGGGDGQCNICEGRPSVLGLSEKGKETQSYLPTQKEEDKQRMFFWVGEEGGGIHIRFFALLFISFFPLLCGPGRNPDPSFHLGL